MPFRICVPVRAAKLKDLLSKIENASREADIVELWLGDLQPSELDFDKIFAGKKKPYLLNVKGAEEQGAFRGNDRQKLEVLLEGARRGAEYCDFDYQFPKELLAEFKNRKKKTALILSAHYFESTPSLRSLLTVTVKMQKLGADIFKIAAMAQNHADLLTVLRLTARLQKEKRRFITISMGEQGRISRIMTPLMDGEMMFASLNQKEKTAEGQMTVSEIKTLFS